VELEERLPKSQLNWKLLWLVGVLSKYTRQSMLVLVGIGYVLRRCHGANCNGWCP
jgi:hypothetical protein